MVGLQITSINTASSDFIAGKDGTTKMLIILFRLSVTFLANVLRYVRYMLSAVRLLSVCCL